MSSIPQPTTTLARHILDNEASADGTSNQFGNKSTNVVEFHSRVIDDEEQLTFYITGIGTYAINKVQALIDMAFASTFERNVLEAYKWLSENYRDGDRIFLFGFSRGAYQVRVLAGMIERVGLLHKGNDTHIPFAYRLYTATTEKSSVTKMIFQKLGISSEGKMSNGPSVAGKDSGTTKRRLRTPSEVSKERCATFKRVFSRDVRVHFVGVWDTVSSIGLTSGFNLPETVEGMSHVCHFRHALALDERRVRFWPEYADRVKHKDPLPGEGLRADVKEVWFAGSHSDVGGGNVLNEDLMKFSPALRWMTYEAVMHGLRMTPFGSIGSTWVNPRPHVERPKGGWFLLEILPLLRPTPHPIDSIQRFRRTRKPHLGAPRPIFNGQRIHESVLDAMQNSEWRYKPAARFYHKNTRWPTAGVDYQEFRDKFVERDPTTFARYLVEDIRALKKDEKEDGAGAEEIISVLKAYAMSPMRIRSLAEVPGAVTTLTDHLLFPELDRSCPREDMYSSMFTILESMPPAKNDKIRVAEFRTHVSVLPRPDKNIFKRCRNILIRHGDGTVVGKLSKEPLHCHTSKILHIAFSLDDSSPGIFSISATEVVILRSGIKDVERTTIPHPEQQNQITSAAMSAHGTNLALGFLKTGVETRKVDRLYHVPSFKEQLSGYKVRRIAFSANETMLAAALDNCTIKIWRDFKVIGDVKTLEGHRDWIRSLVFSESGHYLVSGSDDCTVRIWDVKKGDTQNLEGHSSWIRCVSISPNGERIASASDDCTIRVWDTKSYETLAIYSVESPVCAIDFSPDGKKLVTGNFIGQIEVWDADVIL
ncbi:hypothetical protein AB1N83_009012 [Pleurotus pulmonarius]